MYTASLPALHHRSNGHPDPYSYRHTDTDQYGDSHSHLDQHLDSDQHHDSHPHLDRHRHADDHTDSDSDLYQHGYCHRDPYTRKHHDR